MLGISKWHVFVFKSLPHLCIHSLQCIILSMTLSYMLVYIELVYVFQSLLVATCPLYLIHRRPLRGSRDGNTSPHAVNSVIDHQQINIRSAIEQDRH